MRLKMKIKNLAIIILMIIVLMILTVKIEATTGNKIDLVANEQSLPMSQKRKEKYD